jgi:hypothetical protein
MAVYLNARLPLCQWKELGAADRETISTIGGKRFCSLACITGGLIMCRNIKTLHNFEPPATDAEVRASALQYVRKLSGCTVPSKANEAVFQRAVEKVTAASRELLDSLITHAPPRDREIEKAKAIARSRARFGDRQVA